ncbi:SigE family RNA polymerase sigma factor [Thermomonospora umbrina]|uniref:RNA polymerase sigma-70 factor (Sigma-E family) n=1 Tax=Thermomonospora umbrina TaxID=111806 RepID=A0A3D9SUB7_9ACTN|nr:SigE family RNA polymerase sigma factor [Thermomonospora umbrina]REE98090.1 RNA polymerase sigma-70 factor (sigma-E family) [Thermomonospora umbrina]
MGDDPSFEEFVAGRGTALLRTAVLLSGGSRHDAEDVVQTALEKAYRHWSRIEGDPEPYVRRILVNVTISRARRRRIRQEVNVERVPEVGVPAAADGLALRDVLIRELHRLPARQRAVLVLRYWDDLTEARIAEAMGCSVGTVKSQAAKALARLRAHRIREEITR